ncbi:MAG: glycosyltransferase family 4 protein, partial [Bacilli bacterium]|nr:glycosyltransferase family 4 protein [Bacilli bacterium]
NNYDLIHIHDSESVLYIRDFARFKGNIVLTSHRPEPLEDEIINALKNRYNYSFPILRRILRRIERRSYKLADAFIFPSENAAKIYNDFPGFVKNSKLKPIKYLITGLNPTPSEVSRNDYFKKHNIRLDLNKPIVTYIGRHNRIKGYDRVIESFNTIKSNNACVLVAGAQGALVPPVDDAWIELGYITDALELMYISDLVLIPNRNTYFDLVIIEALSMGKIVITSNTGGNIDIAKDCKGMILFDNMAEGSCEQMLNTLLTMPKEKRQELENSSLLYYNTYCKPSIFASKYNEVISKIYKDLSEHKS